VRHVILLDVDRVRPGRYAPNDKEDFCIGTRYYLEGVILPMFAELSGNCPCSG